MVGDPLLNRARGAAVPGEGGRAAAVKPTIHRESEKSIEIFILRKYYRHLSHPTITRC
jgi:hypothetical protein